MFFQLVSSGSIDGSFDMPSIGRSTDFDFQKYHTLPEMEAYLVELAATEGDVTLGSIGSSFEGRDIWVVDVGQSYNPKIIIDCGIHAREWVSRA